MWCDCVGMRSFQMCCGGSVSLRDASRFVYSSFGRGPVTLGKARRWAIWNVLSLHFCFAPGLLFVRVCGVSVATPLHISLEVPHMDRIINKRSAQRPGIAEWGRLERAAFYLFCPQAQIIVCKLDWIHLHVFSYNLTYLALSTWWRTYPQVQQ